MGGDCIVVVGVNGAGKTWVAKRLAENAGLRDIHNDALALRLWQPTMGLWSG